MPRMLIRAGLPTAVVWFFLPRRLLLVDLLILDDFGLHALDAQEARDIYEIVVDRPTLTTPAVVLGSRKLAEEWPYRYLENQREKSPRASNAPPWIAV